MQVHFEHTDTPRPVNLSMTIRFCGAPSAKGRTSRVKADAIPMRGILITWTNPATFRPAPSCRVTPGC